MTTIVECQDCHWEGLVSDCFHTHWGDEPVVLCPQCGSDRLLEIEEDTAQLTLCPA